MVENKYLVAHPSGGRIIARWPIRRVPQRLRWVEIVSIFSIINVTSLRKNDTILIRPN